MSPGHPSTAPVRTTALPDRKSTCLFSAVDPEGTWTRHFHDDLPDRPAHSHKSGICPIVGDTHEWCPKQKGDIRSPCPALNALANHGYLPRDGAAITFRQYVNGLIEGYGLHWLFAWFLTFGGFFLILQWGPVSLHDLRRHYWAPSKFGVEHNASLVHNNIEDGEEYAPWNVDHDLYDELVKDAKTLHTASGEEKYLDATDTARARVRREKSCAVLDAVHAEIARGEMAIALNLFSDEQNGGPPGSIPVRWMHDWLKHEMIPRGWTRPFKPLGISPVKAMAGKIKSEMDRLRSEGTHPPYWDEDSLDEVPEESMLVSRDSSGHSILGDDWFSTISSRSSLGTRIGSDGEDAETVIGDELESKK